MEVYSAAPLSTLPGARPAFLAFFFFFVQHHATMPSPPCSSSSFLARRTIPQLCVLLACRLCANGVLCPHAEGPPSCMLGPEFAEPPSFLKPALNESTQPQFSLVFFA